MKKVLPHPIKLYLGCLFLLIGWGCAPKLKQARVTYEIRPGVHQTAIGAQVSDIPLRKVIYFNDTYVKEPPINEVDRPPFHLYYVTNWKTQQRSTYKSYLDKYYVIPDSVFNHQKATFKALPGKMSIAGYTCKKAQITTQTDTAIVWYTRKVQARYTPYFPMPKKAFVMRVEQQIERVDQDSMRVILERAKQSDKKSFVMEDFPHKQVTQITQVTHIADTNFRLTGDFRSITTAQFERLLKGYGLEQFEPGEIFPSFGSLIGTRDTLRFTHLRGKAIIVYFWKYGQDQAEEDWEVLQKLQQQYPPDQLTFLTLADAYEDQRDEIETWLARYPLKGTHVSDGKAFVDFFEVDYLPTAVVINPEGEVVESMFSGNGGFEERLTQALNRTFKFTNR